MLSSVLPHILHLLSSWDISIFVFTRLVLNACTCAAIIRDSVSLFRVPSVNHNHWFLSANSSEFLRNCPSNIFSFHLVFRSCWVLLLKSFPVSISVFSLSHLAATTINIIIITLPPNVTGQTGCFFTVQV